MTICKIYFPSLREQFREVAYATHPLREVAYATHPRPMVLREAHSFSLVAYGEKLYKSIQNFSNLFF